MTVLVIGSTAAKELIPSWRDPKDYDVFSPGFVGLSPKNKKVDEFWHPDFNQHWDFTGTRYATLDELYTIKVSHAYWVLKNGSWNKHMSDVVALKLAGAKLDLPLHKMLYSVWQERHGKKRVNLQMDKATFFTDAVRRIYDHDSIHDSVAYGDRPMWESVLKDGQDVDMDMAKVKALPLEEQVKLYREEVYATALERYVIPSDYTVSPRLAYARALQKTITSLTKGWSARFMVEHYGIFRRPDINYVQHHLSKKHLLVELEG